MKLSVSSIPSATEREENGAEMADGRSGIVVWKVQSMEIRAHLIFV